MSQRDSILEQWEIQDIMDRRVLAVIEALYSGYYQKIKNTHEYQKIGRTEEERWCKWFVQIFYDKELDEPLYKEMARKPGEFTVPDLSLFLKKMQKHWYRGENDPRSITKIYGVTKGSSKEVSNLLNKSILLDYRHAGAHRKTRYAGDFVQTIKVFIEALPFEQIPELKIKSREALQELHELGIKKLGKVDWDVATILGDESEIKQGKCQNSPIVSGQKPIWKEGDTKVEPSDFETKIEFKINLPYEEDILPSTDQNSRRMYLLAGLTLILVALIPLSIWFAYFIPIIIPGTLAIATSFLLLIFSPEQREISQIWMRIFCGCVIAITYVILFTSLMGGTQLLPLLLFGILCIAGVVSAVKILQFRHHNQYSRGDEFR